MRVDRWTWRNKAPLPELLTQQKCIVSRLWRPEVTVRAGLGPPEAVRDSLLPSPQRLVVAGRLEAYLGHSDLSFISSWCFSCVLSVCV